MFINMKLTTSLTSWILNLFATAEVDQDIRAAYNVAQSTLVIIIMAFSVQNITTCEQSGTRTCIELQYQPSQESGFGQNGDNNWIRLQLNDYTVKPIYIEHGYNEICLISNFLKIPVKIHGIRTLFIKLPAPIMLWDIPNFSAPGNCLLTLSGDQFCSNGIWAGQETARLHHEVLAWWNQSKATDELHA